jgi:Tfp pilus assembly PilM family ATPase
MPNAKSVTHCRDNSAAAMVVEATRSDATLVQDDSAGMGSEVSLSGWQSQAAVSPAAPRADARDPIRDLPLHQHGGNIA